MKAVINYKGKDFKIDLSKPIDISISLQNSQGNPIAWYLDIPSIEPVVMGSWVGKVSEGASTNFNTITFNPHGHGTHTECLGHITKDFYSINRQLTKFFFTAELISIQPEKQEEDWVITKQQLQNVLLNKNPEAVVIRTLPNETAKRSKNYSHTNPPYLDEAAAIFLKEKHVEHLLIDLPSVDKEKDEGKLAAHKAFWNLKDTVDINNDARLNATITEMIFVDDQVADGEYLLNLQFSSFENDAAPSKPVLYKIE